MGPWDLRALLQLLEVLPASLLLTRYLLGTLILDPLAHLARVPHPSIGGRLLERLRKLPKLVSIEQRPLFGARVLVPAVAQHLWSISVVTAGQLLDPAPAVSGCLHHLSGGLPFADEPND